MTQNAETPRAARGAGAAEAGAQRWLVRGALASGLAIAMVIVWLLREGRAVAPAAGGPAETLALALDRQLQREGPAAARGLAVRPLAAPEADADTAALADSVCEGLVGALARLAAARVASCRSTGLALAAGLDDVALGRLLAVRHVVRGRLQPEGERLRVQLALLDVHDGRTRWAIDEAMPAGELQRLPLRLAQAAAPLLGQGAPADDAQGISAAVYERHLRAARLARRPSIDDKRAALALVEEVLAEAPEHVASLYLRFQLRSKLDGYLGGGPAAQGSVDEAAARQAAIAREARRLGERLIAIDPTSRVGHTFLLNAALEDKRWEDCFAHVDALLRHAAQHPRVLLVAARLHLNAGYVQRAHELAREAARLDALDAESLEYVAATHGMLGREGEMRELLALAAQVGHGGIDFYDAMLAHRRADWPAFERSMTAYAKASQRDADWVPAYARGAADPGAREAAARLLDGHDPTLRHYMTDYFFEYALLGDVTRSLAALARHARQPPRLWLEYLWWPELAAVRQAPAFSEVVRDIGLATLWDRRGAPDLCRREGERWVCR